MAMPTASTAQRYFDATLPNRRVEKDELKEWLKIVGEQNFLDDLEADHGIDELWSNGVMQGIEMPTSQWPGCGMLATPRVRRSQSSPI